MTEAVAGGESPGGSAVRLWEELFNRRRLLLVFAVLMVELGIFAAGLLTPLSSVDQQNLANAANNQFSSVQSASTVQLIIFIFAHNLSIALLEMVPILGAFLFVVSIYSTGLAAQAIIASQGLPGPLGVVLLVFPYSLVELSGYAIAVGAGAMLIVSWRRKRFLQELRVFLLEGVLVAGVLLAAAAMETATKASFVLGFALWLPTGLAIAGVILASRRKPAWDSGT